MSIHSKMTFLKNTFLPLYRRLIKSGKYGWSGNYPSWIEALRNSDGYEQDGILQKVKDATLKVKKGEAVYERDSVLFDEVQYSWPLLSALMWIAAKKQGILSVIDFGGSLGSTFFQNKKFLEGLQEVRWSVVEQQNFVECGEKEISNSQIRFFLSISNAIQARGLPDLLLISCTLQYLENPYEFLDEAFAHRIPYVIIDNTPFNYQPYDRITVQKIHPAIYEATYPCWFLNYKKVRETVSKRYTIIEEYQNELHIHLDGHRIQYSGFLAELKH